MLGAIGRLDVSWRPTRGTRGRDRCESLANLVLALVFCTLVPLLAGIGAWRDRARLATA